jgi:hypothetical protein
MLYIIFQEGYTHWRGKMVLCGVHYLQRRSYSFIRSSALTQLSKLVIDENLLLTFDSSILLYG